jgi:hypothetical protein
MIGWVAIKQTFILDAVLDATATTVANELIKGTSFAPRPKQSLPSSVEDRFRGGWMAPIICVFVEVDMLGRRSIFDLR